MHTSGLVLDVYDDVGGEQLRSFFPTREEVPTLVKEAQVVRQDTQESYPDDAFALVLVNGNEKLRKYACIDGGNTALSIMYFLKNAHKLPREAQRVAAENLKVACAWYDFAVPEELEKIAVSASGLWDATKAVASNAKGAVGTAVGIPRAALGLATKPLTSAAHAAQFAAHPLESVAKHPLGAAMTAMTALPLVRGTKQAIQENLARVHAGEMAGGVMGGMEKVQSANREFLAIREAFKTAEITGSALAPVTAPSDLDPTPAAGTIKKTSSLGRLVQGHRGEKSVEPELGAGASGTAPVRAPQHMNPVVDVTGKERPETPKEKKASFFALPSHARYPLDSYQQVKEASAYFEVFGKRMDPVDRHEFCVNLVKRAEDLAVPLQDNVRKYGSTKYASSTELGAAIGTRSQLLNDPADRALLSKVASQIGTMAPHDFCALLGEFDQSRGLHHHYDGHVMDPFYSTFGFEKQAAEDESWSDVVGNYHITKHELETFALNHWMQLKKIFGMDFAEEFKKDPIGIYSSMPVEQKKLIIRMATENSPV